MVDAHTMAEMPLFNVNHQILGIFHFLGICRVLGMFPGFLSKQLDLNDSTNYKSEIQDICLAIVVKNNEIIKICVL